MKNSIAFIVAVLLWAAALCQAADKVPALINYQGKLLDNSGNIVANGNYELEFRVWSAASSGSLQWGRTYPVNVSEGLFNVVLGDGGGALSGALFTNLLAAFDGSDRFLGLTIRRDNTGATLANAQEIQPRQQLLSAPYALQANDAAKLGGLLATNYLTNGSALVRSSSLQVDDQAYFTVKNLGGGTNPAINFDGNDWLMYQRAENAFSFRIATAEVLKITSTNVVVSASGGITGPGTIPLGGIIMWSGSAVPSGWALCDGANNTPDLRGRFVLGSGTGTNLTPRALGQRNGEETHTLTGNELPSHNHAVTDPGHNHTFTYHEATGDGYHTGALQLVDRSPKSTGSAEILTNTTHISIQSTGGGAAHNIMPPYYVLAFIMRVQ